MIYGTCGVDLTWTLDDKGTLTVIGTGAMENCFYDSDIKSIIRAPWLSYCKEIERVIIHDGVTSIGEDAFYGCTNLKKIKISDDVTIIGDGAFGSCNNLKEINLPDGVIKIGKQAFIRCHSLKKIKIPDSVIWIENCAFSWCTSLTSVTIPARITSIGNCAFSWCDSLKKIRHPEGRGFEKVLSQGNNAKLIPYESLYWKVEGKTLTVGGGREIKFYSYGELPWVDSVDAIQNIVIEEGVEKISTEAFSECKRLELLTIPASVKTIGDCAFTFCYCDNRAVNGGKNVIWSLDDGVLTFKKNPAVKVATDFTIGSVSWRAVEKNITGVKIERDVIPDKKFFDWRNGLSRDVPVSM